MRKLLSMAGAAALTCSVAAGQAAGWDTNATVFWTARAQALASALPLEQPLQIRRMNVYLALAQYRAAEEAERTHAPVSIAVGAASAAILEQFFPQSATALRATLDSQLLAHPWREAARGENEAVRESGARIAARVVRYASEDRAGAVDPVPLKPATAGSWTAGSAAPARELYRARAFLLASDSVVRPPPPPSVTSPEFRAALAEVRSISDSRTDTQKSIALRWNAGQNPRSDAAYGAFTLDLLRSSGRSERKASELMLRKAIAAYDALIACFDAKYAYWYPRPSQMDSLITLPIGLPPHPSYPSAHSCLSGAISDVLIAAFPDRRAQLLEMAEEASLSRIYAGIHYRFDMVAGLAIGRAVAEKANAADLSRIAVLPR